MLKALRRLPVTTSFRLEPPAPAPARGGVVLVLVVRDEARHIGEWARFHRLAGAEHIVAYDDGSRDATVSELRAALPPDRLTVLPWHQQLRDGRRGALLHNQVLAYAHAVRNFGARFRWIAFLDADEFLVPVEAATLDAALFPLADLPSLSLPWHGFGTSGFVHPPPGGVLKNYVQRAANPVRQFPNFKMLLDPCRVTRVSVHASEVDGSPRTWNDLGEASTLSRRRAEGFFSAERLQLNHYYTRSREELLAKMARGSNLKTGDRRHASRVLRRAAELESRQIADRTALRFLERRGIAPSAWP